MRANSPSKMRRWFPAGVIAALLCTGSAQAAPWWVQIEARPDRPRAEERARAWGNSFPDLSGFRLRSGWHALTLGPFDTQAAAQARLQALKEAGTIPPDSFVADEADFRARFLSPGGAPSADVAGAPVGTVTSAPIAPAAPVAPAASPEDTARAQREDATLSRDDRAAIQRALAWFGIYAGGIDGAFGPGTRAAIAAWQKTQGVEGTGYLDTRQRKTLVDAARDEQAALGLAAVDEQQAGIRIDLPLGMVEFDRYDPPFVLYRAKNGSGVTVALVSETGDDTALRGLYEAVQDLDIVPGAGARTLNDNSFVITGTGDVVHANAKVRRAGGFLKGYVISYPATDDPRMGRALAAMDRSFRPDTKAVLSPGHAAPSTVPSSALLPGIGDPGPVFVRSGIFVTASGMVVTANDGLSSCQRIEVEDKPARLRLDDRDLGLAVLSPEQALAPRSIARFATGFLPRGATIAAAGFPYPEAMAAPVVSFGSVSGLEGVEGDEKRARIALSIQPGEAGGPVLDVTGAVAGMLLARDEDPTRVLPTTLTEVLRTDAITVALGEAKLAPRTPGAPEAAPLVASALAREAERITARVTCWN